MPTITIKTGEGDRYIEFSVGRTLREILDSTSFRVRSGCNGNGACGLCRVQIRASEPAEPNPVERIYLSDGQIASGERLACQVRPEDDLEISILGREPVSSWRAIPDPSPTFPGFSFDPLKCPSEPHGVAVDLGTTHISISFYNLSTGQWLAGHRGLNPQGAYGSDVIARLVAASESQQTARDLRMLAVDAIGSAIMDVAMREDVGVEQIAKITLVGNTAMLALLSGRNFRLLLQPSHWMRHIDCLPESPLELCSEWGVHPEAFIEILPPLAGFVGSDLLAGVFSTRLIEKEPGTLFIDFGTNSEVAMWDGESLWVTSAAGGPAFEGCGIGCGSPGEPGAIFQVSHPGCGGRRGALTHGSPKFTVFRSNVPGLDLEFRTIDNENPLGLCGSGIVDLIACLLESGKLTSIGRFSSEVARTTGRNCTTGLPSAGPKAARTTGRNCTTGLPSAGPKAANGGMVLFNGDGRPLLLTKRDVDIFQRAKAAIFAAIRVLLSRASMRPKELRSIYVEVLSAIF